MRLVCLDVGRLLDRRSSGLSAAEGLRLEEHLSTCADCRADANMLAGLSGLASTAHVGLSAAARERAIGNALSAKTRPHAPRAAPRRVGVMLLGAAAALVIGFVAVQRASRVEVAASERVLSGQVEVAGSARSKGAALGSDVQLHAHEAAVVALAHARVELRAGSDARWDGASRKVELQRGSAVFEVDPAPHQSFTVQTRAFTVRVLGTRFEVTQSAVVVLSGRVSVQPAAANANAAAIVLTAGSEQTRFETSPPTAHVDPQPTAASDAPPRITAQTAEAKLHSGDGDTTRVGSERARFGTQPHAANADRKSTDAQETDGEREHFDAQARANRTRVGSQPEAEREHVDAQAHANRTRVGSQPEAEREHLDARARANRTRVGSQPEAERAADADRARAATRAADSDRVPGEPQLGSARTSDADDAMRGRNTAARRKGSERAEASALLERARSELAARDLPQARATLEFAKPLLRDAPLRAQALSLEAECELQAHRYGAARDTYLQVARKFRGMPAAETALFAAARIEAEHGDPKRAAELISNYLSKHPQGSYVREAERRLQLLPKQVSP